MIHQTSASGLAGNEGFLVKDNAAKVAEMVVYKICKGETLPTVFTINDGTRYNQIN